MRFAQFMEREDRKNGREESGAGSVEASGQVSEVFEDFRETYSNAVRNLIRTVNSASIKLDLTPELAHIFNQEIGSKVPDETTLEDLKLYHFLRFLPRGREVGIFSYRFSKALKDAQRNGVRSLGQFRLQEDSSYLSRNLTTNKERIFEFMRDAFKLPPLPFGRVNAQ